ncbi:predicted protein [Histoplasma capsulatum var. duboisii H88]|uniref:Predicted protein n=2 Tax=Ajellomyces capsulatus TaxID=5037 RepID=F0UUE5_AJEC8|nr:predicted protein [Histoplasma capsulatum H143]EGC49522.1 predicted protein [Histoplasma capsulatum var. duboisii H88]
MGVRTGVLLWMRDGQVAPAYGFAIRNRSNWQASWPATKKENQKSKGWDEKRRGEGIASDEGGGGVQRLTSRKEEDRARCPVVESSFGREWARGMQRAGEKWMAGPAEERIKNG